MSFAIKRAHPGDEEEKRFSQPPQRETESLSALPETGEGYLFAPPAMDEGRTQRKKDRKALRKFQRQDERYVRIATDRRKFSAMEDYWQKRQVITQNIPQFWIHALLNHPLLLLLAQRASDQVALQFLINVWVDRDHQEPRCFTIRFQFEDNPFFIDSVLEKEYRYVPSKQYRNIGIDQYGLTPSARRFSWEADVKPASIDISWRNNDVNLTKLFPRILDRNDPVKNLPEEPGTFFNWFEQKSDPYEIGQIIANDIFQDAVDHARSPGYEFVEDFEDPDENMGENDEEGEGKGKGKSKTEQMDIGEDRYEDDDIEMA